MVRRWSYITETVARPEFMSVVKAHRFKVFRKNTKFRKFNRGLLDFVRRKNIKRKRYINYVTLSYLASDWSKIYLNQRSIFRFSQTMSTHPYMLNSITSDVVVKLAKKHSFSLGLNTSSIPCKRAKMLSQSLARLGINLRTNSFNRNTISQVNKFTHNTDSLSQIGLSTYVETPSKFYLKKDISNNFPLTPYAITMGTSLSFVSSNRSVLILLTLLSIK